MSIIFTSIRAFTDILLGPNGIPDANPETVIIGEPLDGTKNPKTTMGMTFTDITGVVLYQSVTDASGYGSRILNFLHARFGFYYVMPLTAPQVLSTPDPTVPPSSIKRTKNKCEIVIGDYNVSFSTYRNTSKTLTSGCYFTGR